MKIGWGTKKNQEVTLAIFLHRWAFEHILSLAVHDRKREAYGVSQSAWKSSDVRLQWDPDHSPSGGPLMRRAIQLGLRGETMARLASGEFVSRIVNISELVAQQRANVERRELLLVPRERVYPVSAVIADRLAMDDDVPLSTQSRHSPEPAASESCRRSEEEAAEAPPACSTTTTTATLPVCPSFSEEPRTRARAGDERAA
eukprot:gnl/Spiro4/964_TR511_c0_g1_i1.p1 gnl/Spiro4/964_TR511_c0_g1~~gnl/Spiro4/964_TR511_c0_g1_i1.p1  ORF type:complete len:201 (+),score=50.32 gnl/Spiro4/964_TR511_c0_g1_i1:330-932(+)